MMSFLEFIPHLLAGFLWMIGAIVFTFIAWMIRDSLRPDRKWLQAYVDAEFQYLLDKVDILPLPMRDVRVGKHTVNTLLHHIEGMKDDPRHTLYHLGELSLMLKVLRPE